MLESLAFALVKTLIVFMFEQQLENAQSVRIQGAPGWYAQQTTNHICESGLAYGRIEAIDSAKANSRQAMVRRLEGAMDSVAYERFRHTTDPAERDLIRRFSRDEQLPAFIQSAVIFENIEYREKPAAAFVRACIPKARMVAYQEERVGKLVKAVTLHRRDRGFDEMETELGRPGN